MSETNVMANLLWNAQQQKHPCSPVREHFEGRSEIDQAELAYAVQQANVQRSGAGWPAYCRPQDRSDLSGVQKQRVLTGQTSARCWMTWRSSMAN